MASPDDIVVDGRIRVGIEELKFAFARSSGAGGQNVNKVNSKVQMWWNVPASPGVPYDVKERFLAAFGTRIADDGTLALSSEVHRDQPRNRDDCVQKLTEMLRSVAKPPKKRRPTKPTRGSVERRLQAKKQRGQTKAARRGDW
jgi:ribosome-associated protein